MTADGYPGRGGTGEGDDGAAPSPAMTPNEDRVAGAMAAFASSVRPDADGWSRIDERLDDRSRLGLGGNGSRPIGFGSATGRRPALVAAALVVFVVLTGAVVVRARTTTDAIEIATSPGGRQELALVALTQDGRLIEVGLDGVERREIYRSPDDGSRLEGRIAVSPVDRTIYVERSRPAVATSCEVSSLAVEGSVPAGQFGQIVAIPFDGGEPVVVVDAGRDPDIAAGTERLAYRAGGADPCGGLGGAVGVVDLATGASGMFSLVGTDGSDGFPLTPAIVGDHVEVPLASGVLDESRWSADGDALWVLMGYGSGVPYRALIDIELAFGGGEVTPTRAEVVVSGVADTTRSPVAADGAGLLGASAFDAGPAKAPDPAAPSEPVDADDPFDPAAAVPPVGGAGDSLTLFLPSYAEGAALGAVLDGTVTSETMPVVPGTAPTPAITGRRVITTEARATLDLSQLGVGPIGETDAETEPSTGQVLVTVRPSASRIVGLPSRVFVIDGTTVRRVDSPAVLESVAWVWVDAIDRVDAPTTTAPDELAMPGSTAPLDPYVTWMPTTVAADEPAIPPTDRPGDAAAIADAYDALFERGDRSAFEGGSTLDPALQEGAATVPGGPTGATVQVTSIAFVDEDGAQVSFLLDHPTWSAPVPLTGAAVRNEGRWQVSTSTMCMLLGRADVDCPNDG
jgi:hypothetical protein